MDHAHPHRSAPAALLILCLVVGLLAGAVVCLPQAAEAKNPRATASASLGSKLEHYMRQASPASGAYVVNADTGKVVFRFRHTRPRILASNTKLFTTATALARFGVDGRLHTDVFGSGTLSETGTFRGSLFLRGGGDPTFGSRRFARRSYGGGGNVEDLAAQLRGAGIRRVTGRVYGDETRFDARRGGPDSGYRTSIYVGPLSALAFNRGLATESGRGFQAKPAAFAAKALDRALERRGVRVAGKPRTKRLPASSEQLATVESPPMARLAALTNKPSDNFFAEMLSKALAMQAAGRGTTSLGARLAQRFAQRIGGHASRLADGSGLSRADKASPYRVTKLLLAMRERTDEFPAFYRSLSVAGRDGTLATRMRGGAARGRCRAKTGTLSNVSALSGYCRARSGELYAFSILSNSTYTASAKSLEDAMAQTIAGAR